MTRRPLFGLWLAVLVLASAPAASAEQERVPSQSPRLRALDFAPYGAALSEWKETRQGELAELLGRATIPELQAARRAGKLSSEELTLFFLRRIQQLDDTLRSYTELNPRCLAEARDSDQRLREGKLRGPLDGMPLSLKDNIGTAAPLHTTVGAEILLAYAPTRDAEVVARLRTAGAVILGKASLSEWAGALTTQPPGSNAVSGIGVNPYGPGFPVLGSSSGSGIATSARLAVASVGTETSGSLISPSAANGVVGMKPSRGLVSTEGIAPLIRFQDSAGPVARSVRDAAVLLAGIASGSTDFPSALREDALKGVKVGVLRSALQKRAEIPSASLWLQRIDDGLRKAGAESRDVTLDGKIDLVPFILLGLSVDAMGHLARTGAPAKSLAELQAYNAAEPGRRIPRGQNLVEAALQALPVIRKEWGIAEGGDAAGYEKAALEARAKAEQALRGVFKGQGVKLLVSLANAHSEFYATAGFPAVTVPLGLGPGGIPNGVTFIGLPGQDAELLACAFAFEQATRLRVTPP